MTRFQTVIRCARFLYSPYIATEMQGFAQVRSLPAPWRRTSFPTTGTISIGNGEFHRQCSGAHGRASAVAKTDWLTVAVAVER